ncbi:hypothetical protein K438DRAFT_195252 [Mycena galopus ATCC 62051]|nr:hypothetical protein K438DRAFT_195252 [Mycena galopus ATCC 62051]
MPHRLVPQQAPPRHGGRASCPPLISLPSSSSSGDDIGSTGTEAACQALSELLARPPPGWSPAVLLEPLLPWAAGAFPEYAPPSPGSSHTHLSPAFALSGYPTPPSSQQHASFSSPSSPYADLLAPNYTLPSLSPALKSRLKTQAKHLVALAEAGVEWFAGHVVDFITISPSLSPSPPASVPTSQEPARAVLAQTLLRLESGEGQGKEGGDEGDEGDEEGVVGDSCRKRLPLPLSVGHLLPLSDGVPWRWRWDGRRRCRALPPPLAVDARLSFVVLGFLFESSDASHFVSR